MEDGTVGVIFLIGPFPATFVRTVVMVRNRLTGGPIYRSHGPFLQPDNKNVWLTNEGSHWEAYDNMMALFGLGYWQLGWFYGSLLDRSISDRNIR
jgi:hypothetical protein